MKIQAHSFTDSIYRKAWKWIALLTSSLVLGLVVIGAFRLQNQWSLALLGIALIPFILMITKNVRKIFLAIVILDTSLQWGTELGWQTEAARLGAMGGLNVSITTIALIALYGLWIAETLAQVDERPRAQFKRSLPLILFILLVFLSGLVAKDIRLSFYQVFLYFQTYLIFLYIISTTRTREDALFIVWVIVLGLILEGLVIVWLRYSGTGFDYLGIRGRLDVLHEVGGDTLRPGGTIGSPNTAASYLSMALALAISLFFLKDRFWLKLGGLVGLTVGGAALLLTLSRGGWLALSIATGFLFLTAWTERWLSPKILITIGAVGLLLLIFMMGTITSRLFEDDRGSALGRVPLSQIALRMIADYPLLGVGANNFAISIPDYITPEFNQIWVFTVHDRYLLIAAESGIGALFVFLWFLGATLYRGWQVLRSRDNPLSPVAAGLVAGLIGHLFHMLFEGFGGRPITQFVWTFAALIFAMEWMISPKQNGESLE